MGRGFGMDTTNDTILSTEQQLEVGVYAKRPIAIVRGEGARLWDADGTCYIDCVGGHGSVNVGHSHPTLLAALQEQTTSLLSCPEIFSNNQRANYLQELAAVSPFPARIFLCNSGAEAIEGSLKFARLITGRQRIIAAKRGFHGRTFGALSATWEPKYREPFQPLVPEFTHVAYNNLAALEEALDNQTAAVILEPVQGEGGVHPADPGYLTGVRRLCDQHRALLILDEIQTGFGRTGQLFACQHEPVDPDILALAKSIAGGLPMGAVLLHKRHGTIAPGKHGTTFGGNPLMCAAGCAVLHIMQDEQLPQQAAEKGAWLMQQLRGSSSKKIRSIRGRGLMIGIELRERVQPYIAALLERGVLVLPAGPTVLRLLPPLVIRYEDLETVVQCIGEVLE